MLFHQDDGGGMPQSFTNEEKSELYRFEDRRLFKKDYEDRPTGHLLTKEINYSSGEDVISQSKLVTVSIISTSRDKDLYILGRKLAKLTFSEYGIENHLHVA